MQCLDYTPHQKPLRLVFQVIFKKHSEKAMGYDYFSLRINLSFQMFGPGDLRHTNFKPDFKFDYFPGLSSQAFTKTGCHRWTSKKAV